MKGVIFTTLANMVEEHHGLALWQEILDRAEPPSAGIYVASATYSDKEMMSLVNTAAELLQLPVPALIKAYGEYLWAHFQLNYNNFIVAHDNLKDFLISVGSVIHIEVKKLQPDSSIPDFVYETDIENTLIMHYHSPRKLCHLAEGLIQGAAKYYNTSYSMRHDVCMHNGDDHCSLEITFNNG